jgi:SAM-dependent methyltransferase
MKEKILELLSEKYPLSAREIHNHYSEKSYSYTHKLLQQLIQQNLLEVNERKYQLSKEFITKQKAFVKKASKFYNIEKNMFLDANSSRILSILPEKRKQKLQLKINSILEEEIGNILDEWYSSYYDKEKKEEKAIKKITKDAKNILEIGCGTGRITKLLTGKNKRVTAIDKDEHALQQAQKNISEVEFLLEDINTYRPEEEFDCIICSWAGLHYQPQLKKIIKQLHKHLSSQGKLIIIEPYYGTEYIEILQKISPRDTEYAKLKFLELKNELFTLFGSIQEEVIQTKYTFPDKETLKQTFRIELVYEEGKEWTEKDEILLEKAIQKKNNQLEIGEAPVILICTKN